MRRLLLLTLLLALRLAAQAPNNAGVLLPNGWRITPPGVNVPLGDLPLNMLPSPDGRYIAVTNNGFGVHSVQLVDRFRGAVADTKELESLWLGLAWSGDGRRLYASGGNANLIYILGVNDGRFVSADSIPLGEPWPVRISAAGLALDDGRHLLYAVTKEDNSLYVVDVRARNILKRIPLGGEGYACVLSPDQSTLYVSCWGCSSVRVYETRTMTLVASIPVGSHPNELLLDARGGRLFVANADDNSVSVISTADARVVETLNAALHPSAPTGSTTNGLALDPAGTTLYVANADNNSLAVFDLSTPGASSGKGFIPTGWYPTCVRMAGDTILVLNGKGTSSPPNPRGPNPSKHRETARRHERADQYIGGLLIGSMSIFHAPDAAGLAAFSRRVYANTPYTKEREAVTSGEPGNPIPSRLGGASPIRHVFYIIKENRTYDQVLGDLPQGNGDTSLVLFGRAVTPNQHALAESFVLLDNFYVDGEVSADGHNWSMGAYATDYLEKTWPASYGGRGGNYDAEGTRQIANNKNGFIWDFCARYGVTYRTYGEFADSGKPNIPVLAGHFDPGYTSWDQAVMDTTRFSQWRRDFDSLLAIDAVPALSTLRFINDHTEGVALDRPTPFAAVADNDLAVGLFVEYLSRTRIWNESAVFIVEDDAQNGPDHVDAHRSTAYLAGGLVKRHFVDHTMYSTSGLLRTIELILGIPPMSQYDAAAEPLWRCFTSAPDGAPFAALPPGVNLFARNTAMNELQRKSGTFDFAKEDRVPDAEFNEVLWGAIRGTPCPPPRHAAFVAPSPAEAEEGEE